MNAQPTPATPGREAIRSMELANGLKIIVWPVRNIPNVALYNWVRAGSRNEAPGITGLAHFFEHMMFNGTARHRAGDFDRLMEAQGGANNAFTSDDVTVYQDWFPRDALELIFDLEAAKGSERREAQGAVIVTVDARDITLPFWWVKEIGRDRKSVV